MTLYYCSLWIVIIKFKVTEILSTTLYSCYDITFQVELVLNLEELLPWRHIYTIKEKVVSTLVKEPSWYDKFLYFIWGGERYDTPGVLDKFKSNFKKVH